MCISREENNSSIDCIFRIRKSIKSKLGISGALDSKSNIGIFSSFCFEVIMEAFENFTLLSKTNMKGLRDVVFLKHMMYNENFIRILQLKVLFLKSSLA